MTEISTTKRIDEVIGEEGVRHLDVAYEFLKVAAEHVQASAQFMSGEIYKPVRETLRVLEQAKDDIGGVVDFARGLTGADEGE